jgi:CRP-like cAMP-binding protein
MDAARLKAIPLFSSFSDEEISSIAAFADEESVAEGERLVREGDFSYEFIAIEEGTAEVFRGDERVAELGPGDFFGEIGVLERALRTASVVASSPMRVITLTGWDLKRMESSMPEAVEQIRRTIEERRPPAGS